MLLLFAWFYFLKLPHLILAIGEVNATNIMSLPGCQSRCGNVDIPYPFGIGENCSINPDFALTCDDYSSTNSNNPPRPVLSGNIDLYNISDSDILSSNLVASMCYNSSGGWLGGYITSYSLIGTPFSFSERNKFFLIGCDDSFEVHGYNRYLTLDFSCRSVCNQAEDVVPGACSGVGCCQTPIPPGIKYYNVSVSSMQNHQNVWAFNPCGFALFGEENGFRFRGLEDLNDTNFKNKTEENVRIVLDWAIGNQTCRESQNQSDYACRQNSFCVESKC